MHGTLESLTLLSFPPASHRVNVTVRTCVLFERPAKQAGMHRVISLASSPVQEAFFRCHFSEKNQRLRSGNCSGMVG